MIILCQKNMAALQETDAPRVALTVVRGLFQLTARFLMRLSLHVEQGDEPRNRIAAHYR